MQARLLSTFLSSTRTLIHCGLILFVLLSTLLFSHSASAATGISNRINYQARLMDASGFPVADGSYSIQFSLYDAATAGTRVWTAAGTVAVPTAISVSVQNGLFTVLLGDTGQNTLDTVDWNQDNLFLGITVSADSEMTPRKRLASAPQAFNARQLNGMYASSTVFGANNLFSLHQTSNTAATGTRTTLEVRSAGTSNVNDFLIRGINDLGTTVFSVNRQGNVTTTGNLVVSGSATTTNLFVSGTASTSALFVNGRTVCLSDGTNCTSSTSTETDTLASVTARGSSATTTVQLFGGLISASTTVTSTFTVMGSSLLQGTTFTLATGTSVTTTNLFTTYGRIVNASTTVLDVYGTASLNGNVNIGDSSSDILTVSAVVGSNFMPQINDNYSLGGVGQAWRGFFSAVTSTVVTTTNLFATNATTTWLGASTVSTTNLFVLGQTVCLSTGTNCPGTSSTDTLQTVTNRGSFTTTTLQLYGGFMAASSTVTGTLNVAGSFHVTGTADIALQTSSTPFRISIPAAIAGDLSLGFALSPSSSSSGISMGKLNFTNDFSLFSFSNNVQTPLAVSGTSMYFDHTKNEYATQLFGDGGITNFQATYRISDLDSGAATAKTAFEMRNDSSNSSTRILLLENGSSLFITQHVGSGSPEGVIYDSTGSIFFNPMGGASGTQAYLKTGFGSSNTGWIGIATVDMLSGGGSSSDANWTFSPLTGSIRVSTSSNDVLIGGASTSTGGVVAYYDTNGTTGGASNVFFGYNTNTNVVIGGTSTTVTHMHSLFTLNGNDLYVSGNIGSASSVYTNGAFVAGTGTTWFGDGYISRNTGTLAILSGATTTFSVSSTQVGVIGFEGVSFTPGNKLNGEGGTISLLAGDGISGTATSGGTITIQGGSQTTAGSFGGAVNIAAGSVAGVGSSAADVTITGGLRNGGGGGGLGGSVYITGGRFTAGSGIGGSIFLTPGQNTGGGDGSVVITSPSGELVSPLFALREANANGTDAVTFQSPSDLAATLNLTLPGADGASSSVLATDGAGSLSFISVCLTDGTNCPSSSEINWTFSPLTGSIRVSTSSNDVLIGGDATSTGVTAYYDTEGTTGGVSNLFLGFNTSTNLVIGGTSTTVTHMSAIFALTGDDLFTAGSIGAATSIFTNVEFIAGSADESMLGNGYLSDIAGGFTISAHGTAVQPSITILAGNAKNDQSGDVHIFAGSSTGIGAAGNIFLSPGDGSGQRGHVILDSFSGNEAAQLRFMVPQGGPFDYIALRAPSSSVQEVYTLPGTDGASSTVIATDGLGAWSFISVCLTDGTNCPQGTDLNWTFVPTSSAVYLATSTNDLVLGNTVTSTGAPAYFDLSGRTNGSSTFYFGHATNSNVVIGGTSTSVPFMHSQYSLNGNDLYVGGNIGSASSIYTNGEFVAGTGTTRFGNGYIDSTGELFLNTAGTRIAGNIPASAIGSATVSNPQAVFVQGRFAYVAQTGTEALQIFDVTNPAYPRGLGVVTLNNDPVAIYVQGNYAYIANINSDNISVVDVTNPIAPVIVSTISTASQPASIYVQGKYLFVANSNSANMQIFDISNPAAVTPASTVTTGANPQSVFVRGRYAYVTNIGADTLQIFDVSNPSLPVNVGSVAVGGDPYSVYVQGRYAYVANLGPNTLEVVDVVSSTAPAVVGTATVGANPLSVFVQDQVAYVVTGDATLQSVDVSSSTNPIAGDTVGTGTGPTGVYIQGRYAYVTSFTSSLLQVFDVGGSYIQQLQTGGLETGTLSIRNTLQGQDASFLGGLTVGQSSKFDGIMSVTASSTSSSVSFVNRASTAGDRVWGAYIDQLLVGSSITATGTANYSMVISYAAAAGSGGLCIDDTATPEKCPTVISGASLLADGAITASAFDLAEVYSVNGIHEAGDVLVLDASSTATVMRSPGTAYDSKVIGVASTRPGFVLGWGEGAKVALAGRVPVKLSMNNGSIQVGDALVSSDVPGYAMKATRPGMVLGYALEDVSATGTAEVFVNVGYWTGIVFDENGSIEVDDAGNVSIANDLHVGGRFFPSLKGGGIQDQWYLFVNAEDPTSTYMSTNADGWMSMDTYDFAERYYSPDNLESGDLVIVSDSGRTHVQRSLNDSQMLLGIVSTRPAFIAGRPATSTYPIALSGRVPTKVSGMNGAIKAGDPLAPTTIPGVAAKAVKTGPIVGLALEDYDGANVGKIEVFVNPGWWTHEEVAQEVPQVINNTTVVQNFGSARRGVAKIAMGSKSVRVTFDTLNAYPFVQATPRGLIVGNWGTDGYTDTGFDIIMQEEQTFDVYYSWSVEALSDDDRQYNSDGTISTLDPLTGQGIIIESTTTTLDIPPVETPTSTESVAEPEPEIVAEEVPAT